MLKSLVIYTLCTLAFILPSWSQSTNPYHINGNAYQENCNCYTLTNDQNNQSGSVWNINKIDLTQSFVYTFNVNLGSRNDDGADGLVFVLQPISTSIGSTGGGLGYSGISPSIGVAIDTWQNTDLNDPVNDHLAVHRNGDINHSSSNNLAGPISVAGGNIEDGSWHVLRISWDATAKTLKAVIDNRDSVTAAIDLVATVFNNDPKVFWGFTGSTGGSRNRQRFCTSLNPGISDLTGTVTCFPTPIQFRDSSASFGSISKWYWNFGDGNIDSVSAGSPPPHVFPAPGIYEVKLNILGNNGCISDTFRRQVIVGSEPLPKFGYQFPLFCENIPVTFLDSSVVQFGTIDQWTWTASNNPTPVTTTVPRWTANFNRGTNSVQLQVKTKEGCVSPPLEKTFDINPKPQAGFSILYACVNDPVWFEGENLDPNIPIAGFHWVFDDGRRDTAIKFSRVYTKGGDYGGRYFALSEYGCSTDTLPMMVKVYETNAFAGRDTILFLGQPLQLQATGGDFYKWSPATGLSDPDIANPIANLTDDTRFTVTATTALGCPTTDEVFVKVIKTGPGFFIPNAFTPNGDGKNDRFRFMPVGMRTIHYFRIYNRYGQMVYNSTDPATGWDGRINGKMQPSGAYVWMLSGIDVFNKPYTLKGTLVLIR